jgi:spore maturation protein CgeB
MRIALFYHSSVSDWTRGQAHFMRGVGADLALRGHAVVVHEPTSGGRPALAANADAQPHDPSAPHESVYELASLDLDRVLDGVDLVIVHGGSQPELVRRIGEHKKAHGSFVLLFRDHQRRTAVARYDLTHYDAVLTSGKVLAGIYRHHGWCRRAYVWHEAADTRVFRPQSGEPEVDVVWLGDWDDGERTAQLSEFLLEPARQLGLRGMAYGVSYPGAAIVALRAAGLMYGGWVPNHAVPARYATARMTVHVPRRSQLPGVPAIGLFEALACGISVVSAPWDDCEGLFTSGADYLTARTGREMQALMGALRHDAQLRRELARHGRATIERRHTCAHRVDELLEIVGELRPREIARRTG